ncbi:MAG: prolipoprotein diacylglyceryl transferase [Clostridia bacterium]|nr:prolipoprotein diacylglyceryl transferase [Clostridia bacterium]
MFPSFTFAGIKVPMYSLMIAIGAFAYVLYLYFTFTRFEKVRTDTLNRMLFVSIAGFAILGISAFVFDALFHSIEEKKLTMGGITWLGGVIGAFPATIFLIHKFVPEGKGRALYFFSLVVPGIVLAHAFGRIGCFFGGCCYGMQVSPDNIFGVTFPAHSTAAHKLGLGANGRSVPVLPTQLFEAVFELILFVVMLATRKKTKKYNIEIYCFAYGVFRFILEFFRGDSRGASGLGLSPSQVISILLWCAATLLILFRNGKIFKKLAQKCEQWQEEYKLDMIKRHEDRRCCAVLSATNAIRELYKLSEDGIITKEEFEKKKQQLLDRIE